MPRNNPHAERTLQDVGDMLGGVTVQSVHLSEQNALRKLREALAETAEDYFEERPSVMTGRWNGKRIVRVSRV